ncbi:MAG: ferrous iron transport protein B [Planctomycetaceae bacterium]
MSTAAEPVTTESRTFRAALIGNPNSGKSTLFNALAGMHARVGNYPGVTVEKKVGRVRWGDRRFDLIDLPGTYSLSPRSLDEMVSVDVLLGRQPDVGPMDVVVCITDATNLERHLYLVSQILDVGLPVVLVLNMWDAVQRDGWQIDVPRLRDKLGVAVVVTEAHRRRGVDELREAINAAVDGEPPQRPRLFPDEFYAECDRLAEHPPCDDLPYYLRERLLLDDGGTIERQLTARDGGGLQNDLTAARERLKFAGCEVPFVESKRRYAWARELLSKVVQKPNADQRSMTDRLDAVLTHRIFGLLIFAALMFVVFQAIYTWAEPLMGACEAGQSWVGSQIAAVVPPGPFRSLLVDGVVAGVGSVVIFLPQIVLLFFFLALLEDCGYMTRAAYMMDRVMAAFGLSGKSFLPLMSSFACAIPGVMATRTIDNHRERMITILIAPLMSCSARLPVYLLLIGTFIPNTAYLGGWVSLRGLTLLAMSSLGLAIAIPVAWLLKKTFFRGEASPFVMELPDYKTPSSRLVLYRVYDRGKAFVMRAGTLIFATTILVWAAGYFPGDRSREIALTAEIEHAQGRLEERKAELAELQAQRNAENGKLIRNSFLGQAGRAIEPIVEPLGWDWKIGVAVIASFPAREVVIATLGTIYSLGGDVDEESKGLAGAMQASKHSDGAPVYNVPVALSIMVFFALCAQCASTLVIIQRETNSWRWPAFGFAYMTALAYVGALITYQVGAAIAGL